MFKINELLKKFILDNLSYELEQSGFKLKSKNKFFRKIKECKQEINILFRKDRGQESGHIQVYVSVTFDEVEKLTAELLNEEYESGWSTEAANIGNLQELPKFIEWKLDEKTDLNIIKEEILEKIFKYGMTFFEQYSTMEKVINEYTKNIKSLNKYSKIRLAALYICNKIEKEGIEVLERLVAKNTNLNLKYGIK